MSAAAQIQTAELSQHLSHEVMQKLTILQTPTLDLHSLVQQQMELNPLLELEENTATDDLTLSEAGLDESSDAENSQLDDDWRSAAPQVSRVTPEDEARRRHLMDSITKPVTLTEFIGSQIAAMRLDDEERADVLRLLGHLNDNGWLASPLESIAAIEQRPLEDMEFAREVLLSLEPAGLGATGLRECLMVQLVRERKTKTLEYHILDECFDHLSRRRFEDIAEKFDVEVEDVTEAAGRIASLNPRPARGFDAGPVESPSIRPELTIEKLDGQWTVTLHRDFTPPLRISSFYKNMMSGAESGPEAREYIREQIRKGRFFISCLEQRQQTIKKVAREIVTRQTEFFENGPAHLKPMTMAVIAEVIGVHETTISRTVCGKFAQTPHGVFELRSFFTSGMVTDSGTKVSSRAVEAELKAIVQSEDGAHPWSDEQLSAKLAERGIRIARRTVMKYRDRLKILPAALRRRG